MPHANPQARRAYHKAWRAKNPSKRREYEAVAKTSGKWRRQLDAKNACAREKRSKRTAEQRNADRAFLRERYATDVVYRSKKVAQNRVNNKKRKPLTSDQLDARSSLQRESYATNAVVREKTNADNRKRYAVNRVTNPDKLLAQHLKMYGIGLADYQRMLDEQGGVCAICGQSAPKRSNSGRLHVDHCHVTGRVRGLLCNRCNLGAGHFDDDPDRLERAARYIRAGARK